MNKKFLSLLLVIVFVIGNVNFADSEKALPIQDTIITRAIGATVFNEDANTNEVIARAYKINSNIKYISSHDLKNIPLKFKVINNDNFNIKISLTSDNVTSVKLLNDKNHKQILNNKFNGITRDESTEYTTETLTSDYTNEVTHTVQVPYEGDNNATVYLKHVSSTNKQKTINVRSYLGGNEWMMYDIENLKVGKTAQVSYRLSVGEVVDFYLSTNSKKKGKATLKITDARVPAL